MKYCLFGAQSMMLRYGGKVVRLNKLANQLRQEGIGITLLKCRVGDSTILAMIGGVNLKPAILPDEPNAKE
jgi:hypothetical protein